MPSPRAPLSSRLHVSPKQKPSVPCPFRFYGGFITEAWPIKSLATGNRFNSQPLSSLPSSEFGGWDWKLQPSNDMTGTGNQPPFLGACQKIKRYLYSSHTGNSKIFRSSVPGRESKTKYIYFYYKSQYQTLECSSFPRSSGCISGFLDLRRRKGREKITPLLPVTFQDTTAAHFL